MGQPQSREGQEPTPGAEGVVEAPEGQPPTEKVYFVGGRERTADEVARDYAESTAENERLRARLEALEARTAEPPKAPKVPTWVPGLTEAGVPEPVVKEMVGWFETEVEARTKAATAEQMAGLVSSLSELATSDAASDAALLEDPQMEGYSPEGLKALLAKNPEFKKRYDRIYGVDPEGAKRLAWVTLKGKAAPRTTGRMTAVPQARRAAGGGPDEEKVLNELRKAAREGAPVDVAKFMRARLAKVNAPEG